MYPQRTRRKGGASCSKGTQTVAIDDIEAAYSDH
jgi:hypothetical protein